VLLRELKNRYEKNKATGPDSIPAEFYQICWDIVKKDIVSLFQDFHAGHLDVSRINYGIITLLPKSKGATKIQQYRLICLLNCIYKLITKVLTIRIEPYAQKLISEHQTAFIKGRNIMTDVMILHEIMHETKKRKETGIFLKLDFEKAYDTVNWDFLFLSLQSRGFGNKWMMWMHMVVEGGTVCRCFGSDCAPRVAPRGAFWSRTVSPTVAQWFVLDARETMDNFVQVRAALRCVIPYVLT
jgi:hypothetical protein